jgi:hypothetical protein
LNFENWKFRIVSDFDIRISNFLCSEESLMFFLHAAIHDHL